MADCYPCLRTLVTLDTRLYITGEWAFANFYDTGIPASSAWYTQDTDWKDTALNMTLSKAFGAGTLGLTASHFGPNFITGPRQGLWTRNIQNGGYFDTTVDDPRQPGKISWLTYAKDPQADTNNSNRVALQGSWVTSFSTLGLSAGVSSQIQPSGPWIQTARFLNNHDNNGHDWYNLFDQPYTALFPSSIAPSQGQLIALYNYQTQHPSYYNGVTLTNSYAAAGYPPRDP